MLYGAWRWLGGAAPAVDPNVLASALADGAVLLDVRTPAEVAARGGTIKANNNLVIPRGWLEFRIADQAPEMKTPIVVYCGTNQRSPLAAATLQEMGYTDVRNYAEGFFVWRDQGLPVEAPDLALDSISGVKSGPQRPRAEELLAELNELVEAER